MKATLILIESSRANGNSLLADLTLANYRVMHFFTIPRTDINEIKPDLIVINAAAIRSSGAKIYRQIRMHYAGPMVVVSVEGTKEMPRGPLFDHLIQPFTRRKLLNHIRKLLLPSPDKVRENAGLQFVPSRNQVIVEHKPVSLTPTTYKLLVALTEEIGHVVTRKTLMEKVWETQYLGDTRTLDVHVSWLRKALGEVAVHPPVIQTVRGKGYCLRIGRSE